MSEENGGGSFLDAISDVDLKSYAQGRGWQDINAVVQSYREAEKLMGVPHDQIVRLPSKPDDADAWNKFYAKLGRPESIDKYELKVPDGTDEQFKENMRKWMFDSGLPPQKAQQLFDNMTKFEQDLIKKETELAQQKSQAELDALKTELGTKYAAHEEMARRAVKEFGIDQEKLNAIEQALGTSTFIKMFANIGAKLMEHEFHDGGSGDKTGIGMTAEQAAAKINALKADQEWVKRYLNKDHLATTEMDTLMRIAHGQ